MGKWKKTFCVALLLFSAGASANSYTVNEIRAKQLSSFSDWEADMSCNYVERDVGKRTNAVYSFVAERGSGIKVKMKVINSSSKTPVGEFKREDWAKGNETIKRKIYESNSDGYSDVNISSSNGGYKFTYKVNGVDRTVLLYPDGFYVGVYGNPSNYMVGC